MNTPFIYDTTRSFFPLLEHLCSFLLPVGRVARIRSVVFEYTSIRIFIWLEMFFQISLFTVIGRVTWIRATGNISSKWSFNFTWLEISFKVSSKTTVLAIILWLERNNSSQVNYYFELHPRWYQLSKLDRVFWTSATFHYSFTTVLCSIPF